jgi:hypothetical protein
MKKTAGTISKRLGLWKAQSSKLVRAWIVELQQADFYLDLLDRLFSHQIVNARKSSMRIQMETLEKHANGIQGK